MLKSNQKNLFDRLYKNMLELVNRRQKQNCNSTLCNLNLITKGIEFYRNDIVIVHCVLN